MGWSRRGAKYTHPMVSLQFLRRAIFFFNMHFLTVLTGTAVPGAKMGRSRRGAKSTYPSASLQFWRRANFFFQHAFFDSPNGTADPGTQTETVPRRGKIHLPLGLFENVKDVLAAQVPSGSIVTSVACGPDCPRPKDCPGLGNPNTLKLTS